MRDLKKNGENGKVWLELFPRLRKIHFSKDPVMIPWTMSRLFGYQSKIAAYESAPRPSDDFDRLEIDCMKKRFGESIDGAIYLLKNRRKIDVLHVYFATSRSSYVYILLFHLLCHSKKIYLKLDCDATLLKYPIGGGSVRGIIRKKIIGLCDVVSIETADLARELTGRWKMPVSYMPVGYYEISDRRPVYEDKKNIFLTVGRLGTRQKATEVLLEAYALLAKEHGCEWELRLVGSIEDEFQDYIREFFRENPSLRKKVTFTGEINDRKKLEEEYARAKIFCLPSRFESFGTVYVEALRYGCHVISSNIPSAVEILQNGYGSFHEVDNARELAEKMREAMHGEALLQNACQGAPEYVKEHFSWEHICRNLEAELRRSGNR